ncbi:MAG: hypothetical protein EOP46_17680 [Sphingobacteriaceae bacterium]|nr:MAG: hypothetical protein EOP46_17680 [Sphingobacteriaceae bacterium]
MKKLLLLTFLSGITIFTVNAQTSAELVGKWKLVKWTKKGKAKEVPDSTYQVFKDNNQFISLAEGKEHKGKWKLSKDNKMLTIRSGIFNVPFSIDYFDAKRRVITTDQMGTLEYQKVED